MAPTRSEILESDAIKGRMTRASAPEHFDGVDGGSTIATAGFLETEAAIKRARRKGSIAAIVGREGLGKTFAVKSIVQTLEDVDVYWVEFDSQPTRKEIARTLYIGIYGEEPTGTRAQIMDMVRAGLSSLTNQRDIILVVDEVQRLDKHGLESLRHAHDHVGSGFGLIFVGGDDAWTVIRSAPMVRSRITRPVHFLPMDKVTVAKSMPKYHQIYRDCHPEVLLEINSSFARGSFRDWASFTSTATDIMEEKSIDVLDADLASNIILLLSGGDLPR